MDEVVLLYTTWPDAETAEAAAEAAVRAGLAACANILAPIRSLYLWRGALQREAELAMLLKTTGSAAADLRDLILRLHPFETPCIVAIPVAVDGSNIEFLAWIADQTRAASVPTGD
jgi:periplasmic divalent cation tolerance protein